MTSKFTTVVQRVLVFLLCFGLAACKVELYSGLTEREANEMLAVLMEHDIYSDKLIDKDRVVTLLVDSKNVARSVNILTGLGYPKERYSSIGDVFQKDGLISSPTEERARYTYSMSQELSSTISMIDGVVAARVHVVLPQDRDSLTDVTYPSSASVFIKYTPELEIAGLIPKVKTLVANSIEGLSLDKITVSLFPASRLNQGGLEPSEPDTVFMVDITEESAGLIQGLVYFLFMMVLAAAGGAGYLYWEHIHKKKK